MKLSVLIKELSLLQQDHGDLTVRVGGIENPLIAADIEEIRVNEFVPMVGNVEKHICIDPLTRRSHRGLGE